MISGGGAFGGHEVMRVVTPEWDLCLYKRGPREFFSSFHHVRTQVRHPEQGPHPTVLATTQAQTPSLQNCGKQIPVDEPPGVWYFITAARTDEDSERMKSGSQVR